MPEDKNARNHHPQRGIICIRFLSPYLYPQLMIIKWRYGYGKLKNIKLIPHGESTMNTENPGNRLIIKKGIPGLFAGFGGIQRFFFFFLQECIPVLEILAEIGLFLVAHPFRLGLETLMIGIFVIEAAMETAFQRRAAVRAFILSSNLFRYFNFLFAAPAYYCVKHNSVNRKSL